MLAVKVMYLGGVCIALWLHSDIDTTKFNGQMKCWPREGGPIFSSHFATWDGAHYLYLSEFGYKKGVNSCAFYPLWPVLIRWFSVITGGNHLIAGMILANVFSAAAWVLFYKIVSLRFIESIASNALIWLIAFPGSLFYQFIYSESIFFLLAMGLWYGLERGRYSISYFCALMLPLARGVGIFVILPIMWYLITQYSVRPVQRWKWTDHIRNSIKKIDRLYEYRYKHKPIINDCLLTAPLLGWGLYYVMMWSWTGNPLEGIQAQKYWSVHSISNLFNIPKFIIGWFTPEVFHGFYGSVLDRIMFFIVVVTIPVIWRQGKDMIIWTYILAILPAMSGTFTSFTRFASVAFPVFIALAIYFTKTKTQPLKYVLLIIFGIVHVALLWNYVNFKWAG